MYPIANYKMSTSVINSVIDVASSSKPNLTSLIKFWDSAITIHSLFNFESTYIVSELCLSLKGTNYTINKFRGVIVI
jgi:hypothetical protein